MNNTISFIRCRAGFTLVEMAVVLVIVGLMMGGLLVPISAQIDQRNQSEVRNQIADIKDALIGYALANGQLPCPATPTTATGAPHAGEPIADCSSGATGVIPWVTLGLKETDPWGHRFSYRVTNIYADAITDNTFGTGCIPSPSPTTSSFALCSQGNIDISATAGGGTLASNVPAVIVSHGKNGAGGYLPTGIQTITGSDADESENSDNDAGFVDHETNSTYDDAVGWVPGTILLNRMVTAGKLP